MSLVNTQSSSLSQGRAVQAEPAAPKQFHPKDFGAIGGGADDRAALQAANDAAIAAGGVLIIDKGRYRTEAGGVFKPSAPAIHTTKEWDLPGFQMTLADNADYTLSGQRAPNGSTIFLPAGSNIDADAFINYGKRLNYVALPGAVPIINARHYNFGSPKIDFQGIQFQPREDAPIFTNYSTSISVDQCRAVVPAGMKAKSFIHQEQGLIYLRHDGLHGTSFDWSQTVAPSAGVKAPAIISANYSCTGWIGGSGEVAQFRGNSAQSSILSATLAKLYLSNCRIGGVTKDDGSICVALQRNAFARATVSAATNELVGLEKATVGFALSGGSRVSFRGATNIGNERYVFRDLGFGVKQDGGDDGDIDAGHETVFVSNVTKEYRRNQDDFYMTMAAY